MTLKEALAWANGEWHSSPYAKTIAGVGDGIDVDQVYGFQCVDFPRGYGIAAGTPLKNGNAITFWTVDQAGWARTHTPAVGEVFVANYYHAGINYGHAGIVVELAATGFYSIDQNWFNSSLTYGSPPQRVFHEYNYVLGYLNSDKIGDSMATDSLTKEEVIVTYNLAFDTDDYQVNPDVVAAFTGKTNSELLTFLQSDPTWIAHKEAVNNPPGFEEVGYKVFKQK